jgi:hypothetical protein
VVVGGDQVAGARHETRLRSPRLAAVWRSARAAIGSRRRVHVIDTCRLETMSSCKAVIPRLTMVKTVFSDRLAAGIFDHILLR